MATGEEMKAFNNDRNVKVMDTGEAYLDMLEEEKLGGRKSVCSSGIGMTAQLYKAF